MSTLPQPSFRELVATFAKIGFLSFGGAAGQIAMMHNVIVEEKRWLDETRYLHALNYCMLLPGPEAQQLATYIGWLLHGVRGGLAAGILFVIPGAALMLGLSFLYVLGSGLSLVEGLFYGIKAAVLAIVVHALLKIARRGLKTRTLVGLAILSFILLVFLDLAFPLVVIGAGIVGAVLASLAPKLIHAPDAGPATQPKTQQSRTRGALLAALGCFAAWWLPIAIAALTLGGHHVIVEMGVFFSYLAVITFGGAYAVLAYLAQAGVERGWATPHEMMSGLGLAETTPGPTILVNQFVAFLGAMREPGALPPLASATLGALMATWATFAPSFLWIFAGAPFVEDVRRNRQLAGALTGITAAVVGVIASLALWFGLHVLFREVGKAAFGPFVVWWVTPSSLDPMALGLTAVAFLLMFALHRGMLTTVAIMAFLGILAKALGT